MAGDQLQLAGEFDTPEREDWLRAVRGVICKRNPDASDEEFAEAFARQLGHRTDDGLHIEPLYTAADAPAPAGVAGFAPFVRSSHPAPVPWEVRQRVWPAAGTDAATTATPGAVAPSASSDTRPDALVELESGATGVLIEVPDDADAALLDRALDGVYLDLAPVSLATTPAADGVTAARLLVELWDRRGIPAEARTGTLGVDPFGAWARTGGTTDLAAGTAAAAAFVAELGDAAPRARVTVADGTVWHDAGATDAQELAWTIAAAAHDVRALVDAGISVTRAFAQLEFRWATTADQFATIAKLRAARRLWARVGDLAGVPAPARTMYQHADGSRAMLTRYDPWVNSLRSTVACFAAAVGGADAVTIAPHDVLRTPGGSRLGRRIARNTQTVLQAESNLARVVDPAGGSWYVEHLTDTLAETAWTILRGVEAAGGITAALRDGAVERELTRVRAERASQVATRKRPLTGLSEFPDIGEEPPPPLESTTPDAHADASTPFPPLVLHRTSEGFERQRGRADRHTRDTGRRPTVFLATIGTPAAFTARATFAKNLFEAAGIATVAGEPAGFAQAGTTVACLCSSDAGYAEGGAAAAAQLRAAGATTIYAAGRRLGLADVDAEVGVGSDVLDVLTRALDELGVDA